MICPSSPHGDDEMRGNGYDLPDQSRRFTHSRPVVGRRVKKRRALVTKVARSAFVRAGIDGCEGSCMTISHPPFSFDEPGVREFGTKVQSTMSDEDVMCGRNRHGTENILNSHVPPETPKSAGYTNPYLFLPILSTIPLNQVASTHQPILYGHSGRTTMFFGGTLMNGNWIFERSLRKGTGMGRWRTSGEDLGGRDAW